MKLGLEVGLAPVTLYMIDGTQLPSQKGHSRPIFGPCLLWPNGWMDFPLSTEVDIGPGDIVLDGDPAPPKKGGAQQPQF